MNYSIVGVDIRDEHFETMAELEQLVIGIRESMITEHHAMVVQVIISEYQQKLLRLERYEQGVPLHVIRSQGISRVCQIPVRVSEFEDGCPNCGSDVHWA